MEEEIRQRVEGIEETSPLLGSTTSTTTVVAGNGPSRLETSKSVRTKVPEVEIHLYRQGKGPIAVFQAALGGYEQDQLEVRDILEHYGFKGIYAFTPESGRGVSIRFHPRNGRSLLPYKDGSVIHIDGEPKDPMIKPVTKILLGVAFITALIALLYSENTTWLKKFNLKGTRIPPWLITCAIIIFTRMRKRTKDFLINRGK